MPKILAIDDNTNNLKSISLSLENKIKDCSVLTAYSGEGGIESAREEQPDTIILDISMSVMDGFEVLKHLKEDNRTKHIPVIILTGVTNDPEGKANCLEHGAEAFLSKPVRVFELTAQVNAMLRIKKAEDLLRKESSLLEQEVNKRTAELEGKNRQLLIQIEERQKSDEEKANLLSQLTMADKMATIGQLAAGVAHEINNPVGFVNSNLNSLEDYLSNLKEMMQMNNNLLEILGATEVPRSVIEIKEKIESHANEIDAEFILKDIDELMADCKEGLNRIKNIVLDLKNFAHPGKEDPESVNINAGIESTLNVISNELKYKATVVKDLGKLPLIKAVSQQLNQVFLNILVNAGHAIGEKGEITIKTWYENDTVFIRIADNGCGISEENLNKIFDPFFTTKEIGKGTGLGMNIANNIVEKHHGKIGIESKEGEGTAFTISLPVNP